MKGKQMKKVWRWIVVIAIFILLSACFFIWKQCGIQIGDKIEASAIVILVFITGIYAYLTHKTLKEAEKRRKADYWERRIIKFYKPFFDKLNKMGNTVNKDTIGKKITENILKDVENFCWERRYMIPIDTFKKINELHTDLFIASIDIAQFDNKEVEEFLRQFRMAESKVRKLIVNELESIEASIRKIYGY
jgi:hypothetical protein